MKLILLFFAIIVLVILAQWKYFDDEVFDEISTDKRKG